MSHPLRLLEPLQDNVRQLRRDIAWNQLLYTAGYSLTSGGFLYYFVSEMQSQRFLITIVLALPELVGFLAIGSPLVLRLFGNRKRLFFCSSLLARCCSILIPFLIISDTGNSRFSTLVWLMALQGIFQSIAFTAYLSWLGDLTPQSAWGRVFGRRDLVKAGILILLPWGTSWLKATFAPSSSSGDSSAWGYLIIFLLGNGLQLASLLPLAFWPDRESVRKQNNEEENLSRPIHIGRDYYMLLGFSWWLAIFQGVTQTAFFLHTYRQLQLSLTIYLSLTGLMYLVQMGGAKLAGIWSDTSGNRTPLMISTAITSLALPFWLLSLNGNWMWLIAAYLLWGGFGVVNLTLQNQLLRVVPAGNNTLPIAATRQGAGLLAGLMGLAGGFWLEQQLALETPPGWDPFAVLFLISWMGRMLAPLWLFGISHRTAESL